MTNAELIAKIKAEIDRRYEENREKARYDDYYRGMNDGLDHFEQFLDTLESEKPMDGLKEEIINYFGRIPDDEDKIALARHFAQWGAEQAKIDVTDFCKPIDPGIAQCIADHSWEMLGEDEKPIQEWFEKEMEKFIETFGWGADHLKK